MHDEPSSSLPKTSDRARSGAATNPGDRPGLKSPMTNSPCAPDVVKTALIQLLDGQIGARRTEIDELMRIRGILRGSGRASMG